MMESSRKTRPKSVGTAAKGGGKRKPLADRTNTIASLTSSQSSSSSVIKPCRPSSTSVFPKSQLKDPNADATSDVSITGTPVGNRNRKEKGSPNPSSEVSPLPEWPYISGAGNREYSGSIYTRRKRKGNSIAEPEADPFNFQEPLATKTPHPRDKMSKDGKANQSGAVALPQKKKLREQELPQEFIKTQKEYFDEIDKFELPVEEVTSADELE